MLHKRLKKPASSTSIQPLLLSVAELHAETAHALRVVFGPEPFLSYTSGQFLTLLVDIEGTEHRRCYSLCSAPKTQELPAIVIKRTQGGLVSHFLNDTLQKGQQLRSLPPMGSFTIDYDPMRRQLYILIAGGSGITPLFSLTQSLLIQEPGSQVHIIYGNRSAEDIILQKGLLYLEDRFGRRLQVQHALERPSKLLTSWKGPLNALLQRQILNTYSKMQRKKAVYFLCGPPPMRAASHEVLHSYGIPKAQIHEESFVAGETSPREVCYTKEAKNIVIRLAGTEHQIQVPAGESILAAGTAADLDMPYSCQKGLCTTCRGRLLQGQVQYLRPPEGLSQEEIEEGYVLCCLAQPRTSDVIIEVE